jgi:hypothetical protein
MHEHYSDEFFKLNLPVAIDIGNSNHFFEIFGAEIALESLADILELFNSESLLVFRIKNFECL